MANEENWARGAYSLWTGGEDCATWPGDRARKALDDWYGATDEDEAMQTIRELCDDATPEDLAWDLVRAIDLLRISLAAEYIDVQKCAAEIAKIGSVLQRRYASWEELAAAFEAGMHAWQDGSDQKDPKARARVQRNLPKLRAEIWPTIDFKAKLG
jgi:hypothetical protein